MPSKGIRRRTSKGKGTRRRIDDQSANYSATIVVANISFVTVKSGRRSRKIARIWFVGKPVARAPSSIWTGHQELSSIATEASVGESESRVDDRQRDMGAGESVAVQKREKKKNPPSSQPGAQPRQTPCSIHVMTGVGPEPSLLNQEAQPLDVDSNISMLDSAPGRTTVEVEEATAGVASSSRTQRRTLELAARIGQRPL